MRVVGLLIVMLGVGVGSVAAAQPPPMTALPMILRLQPNQMAAWRAYQDAEALGRADETRQRQQVEGLNAMQTPQRLDAMADQLRAGEGAFQRHAAATKVFYAVLSPGQKAEFDRLTQLPTPPSPVRADRSPRGLVPDGDRLRVPDEPGLPPPS